MKTITKIKIILGRIGMFLHMQIRWYSFWSKLYRFIYERDYENVPLTRYSSMRELVSAVRQMQWTADTWKELYDAISSPQKVEYILQHGRQYDGKKLVGDCDEFAIYEANVIAASIKDWKWIDGWDNPRLMSICWVSETDARNVGFGGHNVCLLRKVGGFDDGKWCYMDYGYPSKPRDTIREVVTDIIYRYAGYQAVCIGWSIHTPDLKFVEHHSS